MRCYTSFIWFLNGVLIFNCSVSDIVYKRKEKVLSKLKYSSDNMLFKLFLKYIGSLQDELIANALLLVEF